MNRCLIIVQSLISILCSLLVFHSLPAILIYPIHSYNTTLLASQDSFDPVYTALPLWRLAHNLPKGVTNKPHINSGKLRALVDKAKVCACV